MNKNISLSFLFSVLLLACGENNVTPVTKKIDLLTGNIRKEWVISEALLYFPTGSVIQTNPLKLLLDCESDDGWRFYRDGKFEKTENATKCQGISDPKNVAQWFADDNYSKLTFSSFGLRNVKDSSNVTMDILALTDSSLVLVGGAIFKNSTKLELKFRAKK